MSCIGAALHIVCLVSMDMYCSFLGVHVRVTLFPLLLLAKFKSTSTTTTHHKPHKSTKKNDTTPTQPLPSWDQTAPSTPHPNFYYTATTSTTFLPLHRFICEKTTKLRDESLFCVFPKIKMSLPHFPSFFVSQQQHSSLPHGHWRISPTSEMDCIYHLSQQSVWGRRFCSVTTTSFCLPRHKWRHATCYIGLKISHNTSLAASYLDKMLAALHDCVVCWWKMDNDGELLHHLSFLSVTSKYLIQLSNFLAAQWAECPKSENDYQGEG